MAVRRWRGYVGDMYCVGGRVRWPTLGHPPQISPMCTPAWVWGSTASLDPHAQADWIPSLRAVCYYCMLLRVPFPESVLSLFATQNPGAGRWGGPSRLCFFLIS